MKARMLLLCAALLFAGGSAVAQGGPPPPGLGPVGDNPFPGGPAMAQGGPGMHRLGPDPVADNLFPPELIMSHQEAIGLAPEQKTYIREELRKAQGQFTDLQWQLQDAMEALGSMLKQNSVDEPAVLAQLDKVLSAEREIKRTQISLMVRIKNKLTPEQQARLRELRGKTNMMFFTPPGQN